MITSPAVRRLLALLYLVAVLIMADQAADLAASLLASTPTPGVASWRFGAFGLLVSRASVFLIADVMLFTAAIALEHRGLLRGLGMLHLLIAAALLAGLAVFTLDWVQVRGQFQQAGSRVFDLAAARAEAVALLTIGVVTWAGVASIRSSRGLSKGPRRGVEASSLLVDIRRDPNQP